MRKLYNAIARGSEKRPFMTLTASLTLYCKHHVRYTSIASWVYPDLRSFLYGVFYSNFDGLQKNMCLNELIISLPLRLHTFFKFHAAASNSTFHWLDWVRTDLLIENSFRAGRTVSVHSNFSGTRLLSVPVGAVICYAFFVYPTLSPSSAVLTLPFFHGRQPYCTKLTPTPHFRARF